MKNVMVGIFAATMLTAPAMAQDAATSGLRAELRAGYDNPVLSVEYDDGVDSFDESEGVSGIGYGAELGYDLPLGGAIVGAYVGIDLSSAEFCAEFYGNDEICIGAGRNFTAGVRVGAPIGANALVYAKGGYSNGRVDVTYEDNTDSDNNLDEGDNVDGFHLGAGAEVGFSGSTYGKLEYVYTNYNGYGYEDSSTAFGLDLDRHQVMLGFGIRF